MSAGSAGPPPPPDWPAPTSPPARPAKRRRPWLRWGAIGLGVLIVISAVAGASSPDLSNNAPDGAKTGTWDAECEAGFLNTCTEKGAVDNLEPVEIHCRWQGSDVIVHVKLDSTFNARLEVGVIPRYVIEDGGQHGTAFGSEETKVVEPQAFVLFEINAGKPKGVPVGTPISECKPKLYDVALENEEAA